MSRDEIIQANPLPEYLRGRGFALVPAGPNFVSSACPITEHRKFHRCVTIDTAQNLFHCNDCAKGGSIIDWIAFEENISAAAAIRKLGGGRNGSTPEWKIIVTYDYTDEAGKLLFQCVRCEPKDFRQRRPDDNGGWIWNLQGITRVLYRLPEILKAQTICIAEGEKDVDTLSTLGFTATTNPLGAGKWRDEYSETLRGKDVIVFGDVGDPDQKGERHVEQVIQSLTGKAKLLTHVRLPDGFHDVSDYIKSFSSPDEAKTAIEKLIEQAQEREKSEAKPATTLQKAAIAEQPRVAKVEPPQTPVTLKEWRDVIAQNFPPLANAAEICLSVEAQLLINDVVNCFALAIVDPPPVGKRSCSIFLRKQRSLPTPLIISAQRRLCHTQPTCGAKN